MVEHAICLDAFTTFEWKWLCVVPWASELYKVLLELDMFTDMDIDAQRSFAEAFAATDTNGDGEVAVDEFLRVAHAIAVRTVG